MTSAAASAATRTRPARLNHTLGRFAVDATMALLFVLAVEVPLTGLAIHEWAGVAVGAGMVAHLVQHAGWAGTTLTRIFGRTSLRNRLNYLMMAALFVGFVTIIASGLLISETALPTIGVRPPATEFWAWLHLTSVVWVMGLTALHLAINWGWLVSTMRRLVSTPARRAVRRGVAP